MAGISLMVPVNFELPPFSCANDNMMRFKSMPRSQLRNQGIVNNLGHQEGKTV